MSLLGTLVPAESSPGLKSVQRGLATFSYSGSSTTVTISAVDMSKALLTFVRRPGDADAHGPLPQEITGQITNATTLTFSRRTGGNGYRVAWQVVEFN